MTKIANWKDIERHYGAYLDQNKLPLPPAPMKPDTWISKSYRIVALEEAIVFHRLGVTVYKLPKRTEVAKNCLYKPLEPAFGDGAISGKMSDQMLKRLWVIGDNYDYAIEEE